MSRSPSDHRVADVGVDRATPASLRERGLA